jgi:hypothetical protein
VLHAFYKAAILQKHEHCPDRVGIGGGAMGELLLGDAIFFGEQSQEHELVGSHTEWGKVRICLAMHRQVSRSKGHCNVMTCFHRIPQIIRIRTKC